MERSRRASTARPRPLGGLLEPAYYWTKIHGEKQMLYRMKLKRLYKSQINVFPDFRFPSLPPVARSLMPRRSCTPPRAVAGSSEMAAASRALGLGVVVRVSCSKWLSRTSNSTMPRGVCHAFRAAVHKANLGFGLVGGSCPMRSPLAKGKLSEIRTMIH